MLLIILHHDITFFTPIPGSLHRKKTDARQGIDIRPKKGKYITYGRCRSTSKKHAVLL